MISVNSQKLPHHVAIIMDGNGRWAKKNGMHRIEGHRRGVVVVEDIISLASDLGIEYLTLYAFSIENWNRPELEVYGLMDLLKSFLASKRPVLIEKNIRFRAIGHIDKLPDSVIREITLTIDQTKTCAGMTLILALSYGARLEMMDCVNNLVRKAFAEGDPGRVFTEEEFSEGLYTEFMPDPDLLIRTSGEYRISNFLLWQLAYAELYFTEKLWPEFSEDEFLRAIRAFQKGKDALVKQANN